MLLIDSRLTHIWKPSLHEVAAGTLDLHWEGLSYQMLAHDNGVAFVYGAFSALDHAARSLTVSAVPGQGADPILPERTIPFTSLVIAVGSVRQAPSTPLMVSSIWCRSGTCASRCSKGGRASWGRSPNGWQIKHTNC